MAKRVVCVQHRDGWCAAAGPLDPNAARDETRCGLVVTLRIGSAVRVPDCPECKQALRAAAAEKGGE